MARNDLLRRTKALWEPRYGRKLSDEEAREIVANVTEFFTILEEWASREDDAASAPGATKTDVRPMT